MGYYLSKLDPLPFRTKSSTPKSLTFIMEPFDFLQAVTKRSRTLVTAPKRMSHQLIGSLVAIASLSVVWVSPAIAGILNAGEFLQRGDSGPKVAALQRQLSELGLYSGTVTEFYGPQTQAAVSAYQQSLGLTADGIFGTQTDMALFDGILTQVAPSAASTVVSNRTFRLGERVLSLGDQGPDVQELQTLLSSRFSPLTADGVFGSNTQSVVTNFQRQYGLLPDGQVGPATLTALSNAPVTTFPSGTITTSGIPIQTIPAPPVTSVPLNANRSVESSQATISAAQINRGPYTVVIPADSDDVEQLNWIKRTEPRACMARSRRGSYIFAGGYSEFSNAETVRLTLQANRPDVNTSRTDARVDYRRGDFTVECLY